MSQNVNRDGSRQQVSASDQAGHAGAKSSPASLRDGRAAYDDLLGRVAGYVDAAPLILCGMGACVDARVAMHDMDGLLTARDCPQATALAALLRDRAARGVGGEVWIDWPDGPQWLARHVPVRYALGGTGPQAARVLTALGARALMALEDRSEHMMAQLDARLLLAEHGELVAAARVAPRGPPRPDIFIFEYTDGKAVGDVVPRRSSRIIVRFNNLGLEHDAEFDRLSARLANAAGAGLLSGFSAVPTEALPAEIARVGDIGRAWRASGMGTVHLELAGFDTPELARLVLEGLRSAVSSVGMSHSEFLAISPERDLATGLCALGDGLGIARVCVHADDWAATATKGDAGVEHEALMMGCLLASARAAAGEPVRPTGIDPEARFQAPPFPTPMRRGEWTLVSCPSPYLAAPVTTLGLGDTFTAGCLLVLAQRPDSVAAT